MLLLPKASATLTPEIDFTQMVIGLPPVMSAGNLNKLASRRNILDASGTGYTVKDM
jgi:hypothetical protein